MVTVLYLSRHLHAITLERTQFTHKTTLRKQVSIQGLYNSLGNLFIWYCVCFFPSLVQTDKAILRPTDRRGKHKPQYYPESLRHYSHPLNSFWVKHSANFGKCPDSFESTLPIQTVHSDEKNMTLLTPTKHWALNKSYILIQNGFSICYLTSQSPTKWKAGWAPWKMQKVQALSNTMG